MSGLSHLHCGIEDCDTMRMVSLFCFYRIEDYEPMRMVTSCLRSEIEHCEPRRTYTPIRSVKDIWSLP